MTDHHFIPASPGYWLVDLVHPRAPDGAFKISRAPIIAWELRPGVDLKNVNFFGHPVTIVWSPYRDAFVAILCPDGLVRLTSELRQRGGVACARGESSARHRGSLNDGLQYQIQAAAALRSTRCLLVRPYQGGGIDRPRPSRRGNRAQRRDDRPATSERSNIAIDPRSGGR